MNAVEILHHIEQQTGISGLSFDDQGACVLEYDGRFDVIVNTDEQRQTLMISAVVGELNDQDQNVCEWLLEANVAQLVGGAALFCLDSDSEEILLAQVFNTARTEPQQIFEAFSHLLADADEWRQRLQDERNCAGEQPLSHHHFTRV